MERSILERHGSVRAEPSTFVSYQGTSSKCAMSMPLFSTSLDFVSARMLAQIWRISGKVQIACLLISLAEFITHHLIFLKSMELTVSTVLDLSTTPKVMLSSYVSTVRWYRSIHETRRLL